MAPVLLGPLATVHTAVSPRSTVLVASMTTNVAAMNESNDVVLKESQADAAKEAPEVVASDVVNPASSGDSKEVVAEKSKNPSDPGKERLSPSQQAPTGTQIPGYPPHVATPQQPGSAYYLGYAQSQVTPEPPSPATGGVAYDVGSFFQQPGAFAPHTSNFGGPSTPLSPPRATTTMGVIPPASPLFPRVTHAPGAAGGLPAGLDAGQRPGAAPPSPNLPYMSSPAALGSTMYQPYPVSAAVGLQSNNSPEDGSAWNEQRNSGLSQQQSAYQQLSPQIHGMMPYGMPPSRAATGGRAMSFEEPMLPPSALDQQPDQANPAYSPYGGSQNSPNPGATLFAQQPWGYGGPPDMYSTPGTPLQPRPSAHPQMGMYPGPMTAGMRPMGPYAQYYPASSPGPPIQTTASNKGPDGANLFIFHIPNHFTNLDMYQLFCPYGTLLSVRIMVEKDTGRSRGFGFVSYDSPESAALAIKELNGFAIGNKRLKVQHKQIRPKDVHHDSRDLSHGGYGVPSAEGAGDGYQHFSSLPPSGPMASAGGPPNTSWFDGGPGRNPGVPGSNGNKVGMVPGTVETAKQQDDGTELTSNSTAETPLHPMGPSESPLASLGTLQNALPDVAGNGNTPE